MNDDLDRRPVRQILASLSQDAALLLAQTAGLARAELRSTASALAMSIAGLAAGALIAIVGGLALVSALVLVAVALGLPAWAASALVGAGLTAAGTVTVRASLRKLQRVRFDLQETRRSITETLTWLKAQTAP